ncbi:MAG TPA: bifunctional 3-(3-hydroxy-phenyl)propionate/3-hydroxycinnamic acid hydroxylase [Ramlibacter sp.]|nr:bifunctional 3-(3-hydroxy-phenyl)propionate/3-hydroxycinnamic acid hydroxylase [Ramlibacter sp.]
MNTNLSADVVIVGAGPVGLTLANLLGGFGVRTLLVERNAQVEGEPRAVTLDDESLRTMQAAGLIAAVLKDVVLGYGVQYFDWRGRPFAAIQPTRQEYGYPKRNAFRQPLLVSTLADGLARFANVNAWFGHELVGLSQSQTQVSCTLKTREGETRTVTCKWLVACDGGRSPVRELCGIVLDGETYPERWLIVDLADRTVPLRHTQTYCDPRRPAIRLPGPQGALRYEFMLRAGDRDEDVLDEKTFRGWIADRVPQDAALPLVRKAIYGFHARVATKWKSGRVLLAGDAAHLTPPFAGQGLNSGIRDASNLAWKLAAVTRWGAGDELIDSYEPERRPHAAALIRMALRIGSFMQPKSRWGAALGQAALRLACTVPACRNYILQLRFKPRPELRSGFFEPGAARPRSELLPQPLVQHRELGLVRLDEVLGNAFAVIGRDSPQFREHAARLLPPGVPGRVVAIVPCDEDFLGQRDAAIHTVRDATGELGALFDRYAAAAVVVRPDRYWYRLVSVAELAGASLRASTLFAAPAATLP